MRKVKLHSLVIALSLVSCGVCEELQQLFWKNGDVLTGSLVEAQKDSLVWKSPDFTLPFELDLDALSMIRVPRVEEFAKTSETHQAVFRTGDVMYGMLKSISQDTIVLQSKRHGSVPLFRDTVRSLRSLKNDALIYAGPTSLDEWEMIRHGKEKGTWELDNDGRLATSTRDAAVFNGLEIPELAQIEFVLRWTKDPAFMLSLFKPVGSKVDSTSLSFLIDTWDDEVVMETESDFEPLFTLNDNLKEIIIRLYWDRQKGLLSVYSGDGQRITTMEEVKGNPKLQTGIYLRNKGANLSIGDVRVGKWNGKTPQPVKKGQSRLHLSDGNILYGEIREFIESEFSISIEIGGTEMRYALDHVDSIYFEDDDRNWDSKKDINLSYFDGERLSGEIFSIKDNLVELKTLYSKEPIVSKLPGVRTLKVEKGNSQTAKDLSLLEYDGGRIHGKFAGGKTADTAIAWIPFGSQNASPLTRASNARVIRATPGQKQSPNEELVDVLYLRNGDVLPCRVHAISKDVIHIKTGFGENDKIAAIQVKAIELASDSEIQITGFTSDRWKFRPDDAESFMRTDQSVTFRKAGTLGHATILRGNELRFDATWDNRNVSQLELRMFSGDAMRQTSPAIGLQFTFSTNQIMVGPPQNDGAQVPRRAGVPGTMVAKGNASIRVVVEQDKVKTYVDDKLAYSDTINRDDQNGRGLGFHLKSFGRNQANESLLTLSNFEIRRSTNAKRVSPRVNPLKKQTVLTNPRMYRDKAPSHIVIGKNGDLLRGRLETLGRDQIAFISRMDDLTIPRSRVSALVWLHKDELDKEAEPPKEITKDRVRLVFVGGTTISITPTGFEEQRLNGESVVLGKCSIPIELLSEIHVGNYVKPNETATYADWKMTAAPEPKMAGGSATGQDGESFGKDSKMVGTVSEDFEIATVDGQPFRLHDQRGKIVILDFWATWCGPCIRSLPEIMAAVDEFEENDVVLCGVNLQEANADVKQFLENRQWNLNVVMDTNGEVANQFQVNAVPTTVIIDKDGTIQFVQIGGHLDMQDKLTSAIQALLDGKTEIESGDDQADGQEVVGSDFSGLELPVLNGKTFKVGQNKKIVILDFWATWCGPCVKALPEIAKIAEDHKEHVELIAVNQLDPAADVEAFVEQHGWTFEIAMDVDGKIGEKFQVENLPHTVVIGTDGKVQYAKFGYKEGDSKELADQIKGMMESRP